MSKNLPVLADFTAEEISKAVRQRALDDPVTLTLATAGVGGGALFWALGWESLALALPGFVILAVGKYVLDTTVLRHRMVRSLVRARREYLAGATDRLAKELEAAFARDEQFATEARQLAELEDSYQDLIEMIDGRFQSRGLVRERLEGMAAELRRQALERLSHILDLRGAVTSIPVHKLQRELKSANAEQRTAIAERLDHVAEVERVVKSLRSEVEQIITRISEVTLETAQVGMSQDTQLEELLARQSVFVRQISEFKPEI